MPIDQLHTRIDGLIENRRDILESAMQSALLLKNIKIVRSLSRQKKTKIIAFKKNLKEISGLINELELEDIQEPKTKRLPKKTKKIALPKPEKIEIPKEKTELERELDDIQEKLRNLSF